MPRMGLVGFFSGVEGTISNRGAAVGCLNREVSFASVGQFFPHQFLICQIRLKIINLKID